LQAQRANVPDKEATELEISRELNELRETNRALRQANEHLQEGQSALALRSANVEISRLRTENQGLKHAVEKAARVSAAEFASQIEDLQQALHEARASATTNTTGKKSGGYKDVSR
jgi:hypothetical protein